MDSPGAMDDEVIADSEGEMGEEEHPGNRGVLAANSKYVANTVSQVSTFTLSGQLHGKTTSPISAFPAGPSAAFWKQNSLADNTDTQLNQISDIDNFIDIASIADRAKTRQRNPKSSIQSFSTKHNATASSDGRLEEQKSNANLLSDIIELTSDEDDDELSLRPSKRKPKARPKPKPKLKAKDKLRDTNDKTLTVSGTTEISIDKSADAILDSRPRPRPRPLVKRSKTARESTVPPLPLSLDIPGPLLSSSDPASHGLELPIATSPIRPHLHTSQLPPSDPPLPTLTTIHDEDDLPRIETLPNLDFDGLVSSPSSLFSDLGGTTKKRKRAALDLDIDELASDGDLGSGQGGVGAGARYSYNGGVATYMPPHTLPPPPTFFAGSSSSSIGGGGRRISPQLAPEGVDLTMLPPMIEPIGAAATKKVAKAKISRQKKGDAIILDEDELDGDFNPTESTKKGKAKPKAKKGADTKARQDEGQGQVEVSIVSKPRIQKTKGKCKEKERATAGNRDTFKSREFIDNSDDEEDPIQLIPGAKDPATPSTSTNGKGVHISTSVALKTADTSVIASVGATSTLLSKTLLEENMPVSPGDKFDSGKSSFSSNRMNKKRKSILEDEGEGENHQLAVGTSSNRHKGKQGKNGSKIDEEAHSTIYVNRPASTKKGKKGKTVVSSDEDEEDNTIEVDLDPSAGLSKGRKLASRVEDKTDEVRSAKKEKAKGEKSKIKSKKAVEDTSKDDNAYMEDHEEHRFAPEAEMAKENVIPPIKSTAKTSKPGDRPNVENPGLFPSLHSRYEIAPRRSSLPMSELIRRANSIPGSPFATPHPRTSSTAKPNKSGMGISTYSPYLKSSRSLLSRIAPLHPNRRTPPPPLPPPPPKKKTKKELEMEEKWEEEMIDSVGGISEWACLDDDEKKGLRRAKWAMEMGDWDD